MLRFSSILLGVLAALHGPEVAAFVIIAIVGGYLIKGMATLLSNLPRPLSYQRACGIFQA